MTPITRSRFRPRYPSSSFAPGLLFLAGEQGAWYDPSDLSTLFQDAAGTVPVTAVEQPVRLMRDKSGRGNHATAPSDAARPVLRARYNLLTNTIFSGAVAGTPGTAPTGWSLVQITGSIASVSNQQLQFQANAQRIVIGQLINYAAQSTYRTTFTLHRNSGGITANQIFAYNQAILGATETFFANGISQNVGSYVPVPGDLLDYRLIIGATAGSSTVRLGAGCANPVTGNVTVSRPDIRLLSDATSFFPSYQRVTTSSDYEIAGFLPYLAYDGTSSAMATSAIDFTGTSKMSVFAGLTKLSDAAQTAVAELSATIATNNGSFLLTAPNSAAANYNFSSKGTTQVDNTVTTYASPNTSVISGLADISAPSNIIRVNGVQAGSSASSQGTGNFGNYPLFIGSRNNASLRFNGRLYGMVVRGAAMSAAQIIPTERWLAGKTGVTI